MILNRHVVRRETGLLKILKKLLLFQQNAFAVDFGHF